MIKILDKSAVKSKEIKDSYLGTGFQVNLIIIVHSAGSRISHKGAVDLVEGGVARNGYVSKNLCMSKRKNLDPWGVRRARPPRSANGT